MIDHSSYATMLGATVDGRARKAESDMVMLNSWWEDIQSQTAYLYDYYHDTGDERFKLRDIHPQDNSDKIPIPIKFIRHEKQSYNKDPVTFWLQLQPGQECNVDYYDEVFGKKYSTIWPVGLYIDIMDESGKYNKWLIVNTANFYQNQFPTYELLACDYVFQWIHKGKRLQCAGVLQSQNSYNSGIWTDYKFSSVEDQQKFAVPINDITETIYYNKYMIIDSALYNSDSEPRRWKVSKVNRISPNGISRVTLVQDIFDQHRDYIERDENGKVVGMWANYYDSYIEPISDDVSDENYSSITSDITCSGKCEIKVGGSAKTFTVNYYDINGNMLPEYTPGIWSFKIDGNYVSNDLMTLSYFDDTHKIKFKFLGDDTYIGKILHITNTSNQVTASLDVEIVPL